MKNTDKTQVFRKIDSLPSLPATVSRVMAVTADPESCGDDLVDAILPDQSMCATILKIANSAFFGIPREVATMDKAVNILGFNEVHNIVLGKAVFNSFQKLNDSNRKTIDAFWYHSFTCALAAKIIAEDVRCPPSELFIAGLIHDIGKLAFFTSMPDEYLPILQMEKAIDHLRCREAEIDRFGIDHAEVGLHLLTRWMFPEKLLATVGDHHQPEKSERHSLYATIVQLSDVFSLLAAELTVTGEIEEELDQRFMTLLPNSVRLWREHNLRIDREKLEKWLEQLMLSIEKDSGILHIFTS